MLRLTFAVRPGLGSRRKCIGVFGAPACIIINAESVEYILVWYANAFVCCADVRLYWHPQGDYLAVQVDRFTKTRKSTFTAFELFSVKEKDIPMEVRFPTHPFHPCMQHQMCACGTWSPLN